MRTRFRQQDSPLPIRDLVIASLLAVTALAAVWLGYAAPRAARLTMATPAAILPSSGFQDLERFPEGAGFFRWSSGSSILRPANPGGIARLTLQMVGGPAGRTPITLQSGSQRFDFITEPARRTYLLLLAPQAAERLSIRIETPAIVVSDRTLGVMVADVAVRGGGRPPAFLGAALVFLALALYALLRGIGWKIAQAAGATLAIQLIILVWLALGGWMTGQQTMAALGLGAACMAALVLDRWKLPTPPSAIPGPRWSAGMLGVLAGLVALALVVRAPWLTAPDPVGDLELAARRMFYLRDNGLAGAYLRGGDYMPLRLYLLWSLGGLVRPLGGDFFAPLPGVTMLLIKLPQLLADLAIVGLIYGWGRRSEPRWAALVAAAYAISPPIWMNVAWWGQVDALLLLPLVLMTLLFGRANGRWSWVCWALALLIKAQAIIFAPLLFVVTLRRYGGRGFAVGAALAAGLLALGCAPLILAGQGFGLAEAYLGSVGRFPRTTYGAYNLWHLFLGGVVTEDWNLALGPLSYRVIGLALVGSAALLACALAWRRSDPVAPVRAAALLALAFFLLPTQIHERYLFIALPFLALWASMRRSLLLVFALLSASAALNILGILNGFWPAATDWLEGIPLGNMLAMVNLLILAVLLVGAVRDVTDNR